MKKKANYGIALCKLFKLQNSSLKWFTVASSPPRFLSKYGKVGEGRISFLTLVTRIVEDFNCARVQPVK